MCISARLRILSSVPARVLSCVLLGICILGERTLPGIGCLCFSGRNSRLAAGDLRCLIIPGCRIILRLNITLRLRIILILRITLVLRITLILWIILALRISGLRISLRSLISLIRSTARINVLGISVLLLIAGIPGVILILSLHFSFLSAGCGNHQKMLESCKKIQQFNI